MTELDPAFATNATDDLAPDCNDLTDADWADIEAEGEPLPADIDLDVERLSQRRRHLRACITIPAAPEWVWQVLTDYDRLAEFIPSLRESCRLGEADGCTLLRQVGVETFLRVSFSAAVVLKMQETYLQRIDFGMTEGDFNEFEGSWELEPVAVDAQPHTQLTYVLRLQPPRRMPARLIEGRLRRNLCDNLTAVRREACARAVK
ncbi:MAG: SRPBCC family protein [Cyanobacteria bacterium J06642_2]